MRRLLLVLIVATLAACQSAEQAAPATQPVATQTVAVPVVIAETPTAADVASSPVPTLVPPAATETVAVESTAAVVTTPTPVPPAPPAAPTATEVVAGPAAIGVAAPIWIQSPGVGSTVVSPVRVVGEADGTFEQNLVIRIVSMDGDELALVPTQIQAPMPQRGAFSVDVPFAVTSNTQALIQVFADSPRDGGIIRLASVPVTLLASGTPDIKAGYANEERIVIQSPTMSETISGGSVTVTGVGIAGFEQTLVADLLDADGNTLDRQPITVQAPDFGQPGPFSVTLTYRITGNTPARVVVRDSSPANGATTHLSSVEVTLAP